MARLEDLTRGAQVKGVRNDGAVEVVDVKWSGTSAIELTFKDVQGKPGNELLCRTDGQRLDTVTKGPAWSFAERRAYSSTYQWDDLGAPWRAKEGRVMLPISGSRPCA